MSRLVDDVELVGLIDELKQEEYNRGLNEAWELARKIFTTNCAILQKVFGHSDEGQIIMTIEPQEALAKLEAYEKEQKQIKVGDVVENINTGEAVVLEIRVDGLLNIYSIRNSNVGIGWNKTAFKKTGKHVDIAGILAEIGKE